MEFLQLVKERYSCRKYRPQKVEKEKLLKVLEAGRLAPSAVNYQPWSFVVIQENPVLDQIKMCYAKDWLKSAPCIIVVCGDHEQSWKRDDGKDHCDIDVAIATDHITLAAAEQELGTCWVCKFDAEKCKKILQLPSNIEPVVLLPVGYPEAKELNDRHLSRKNLEQIVYWEKYQS
jgi:nitroreductase